MRATTTCTVCRCATVLQDGFIHGTPRLPPESLHLR
jgi:hypothetical protein